MLNYKKMITNHLCIFYYKFDLMLLKKLKNLIINLLHSEKIND